MLILTINDCEKLFNDNGWDTISNENGVLNMEIPLCRGITSNDSKSFVGIILKIHRSGLYLTVHEDHTMRRLYVEYSEQFREECKNKIIAVDFDGTLFSDQWPNIGIPNLDIINYVRNKKAAGAKIILWTCRVGSRLDEAVAACKEYGLEFDAVNKNLPDIIAAFGLDCRKVFAHEYIDDRAVHVSNLFA